MKRRRVLTWLGAGAVGLTAGGAWLWPDEGLFNDCPAGNTPRHLLTHDIVQAAWEGIDPTKVWDCHAHLVGMGDSSQGVWLNPDMRSLAHPTQYLRYRMLLNAACVNPAQGVDASYVTRLQRLLADFPPQAKCMLLAFDYCYTPQGQRDLQHSGFAVSDAYAAQVAQRDPSRFEWIASIHPYRDDCVEALEKAVSQGARAVKWLPPAMNINPASPRCDAFYQAMVRHQLPLLTHGGDEHTVDGIDAQSLGNPLLLRRALDQGVRVIVAHCAGVGTNIDLDKGASGPVVKNFALFTRLMEDHYYAKQLYGDISATIQLNRIGPTLETLVMRDDWQHRLLNGSDYPLPAVMPIYSNRLMYKAGYLTASQAKLLAELRRYNGLLADFVMKRSLRVQGKAFAPAVFETRRFFASA
ncbi:MAG: amidohydrolase family protein [Gammaproteobacteria bacterium]|nr:amidohydrolase family protein [Gammaproteobacteria bacterium]